MEELSQHDKAVLNCVFNPHLPLESAVENLKLEDEEELTSGIVEAKELEIKAIELAEANQFVEALSILNNAIQIAPEKPSLYNNRAQVFQYLRRFDDAMEDVTRAVNMAKGTKLSKTLCKAHVQKGILHRRKGEMENARIDFQIAADMGDVFAKNQIVELNPYAALCNNMLKQVMETWK